MERERRTIVERLEGGESLPLIEPWFTNNFLDHLSIEMYLLLGKIEKKEWVYNVYMLHYYFVLCLCYSKFYVGNRK